MMKQISQLTLTFCAALALSISMAHATKITSFSPQGEIAEVRQVTVQFDETMVPMGDPNATAPIILNCEPKSILEGQGRWVDEKIWVFDFKQDLPTGTRCSASIATDLRSLNNIPYEGNTEFSFHTGGPFVSSIRPWEGTEITEDQIFLLHLSGDATPQSIKNHVWCSSSAVGERIPVKLVEGKDRESLLELYGWEKIAVKSPLQYWILQCQQRFNPDDKVRLVYDIGVASPTSIVNSTQSTFDYSVREPFKAQFSCTRENANAHCMPLSDMILTFNAPLPWTKAQQIKLTSEKGQEFPAERGSYENSSYDSLNTIVFKAPLPENTSFTIHLPEQVKDDDGRALSNADSFPLEVKTDQMPVLAKFSTAPFGIIELYSAPDEPPMVPLTVRNIETELNLKNLPLPANQGTISQVHYTEDAEIIRWFKQVERLHAGYISYNDLKQFIPSAVAPPQKNKDVSGVETRRVSLLENEHRAQKIELSSSDETNRSTEVLGIPLTSPGYHILELASPALGEALLKTPEDAQQMNDPLTMYVRTGALVTNLSAHVKIGRESSLVWVTRLNDGHPVPNAQVHVRDCAADILYSGTTDDQGRLHINQPLLSQNCKSWEDLFVSARAADSNAKGEIDMTFTFTSWDRGIESWRFGYPQTSSTIPSSVATTVFDRTLLRAGETVSMKHYIRDMHQNGFVIPHVDIDTVKIVHQGSGDEAVVPLTWQYEHGGFSASSSFIIPAAAKLGTYSVYLINKNSPYHNEYYYYSDDRNVFYTGDFQVEEFRLPVLEGSIHIPSETMPLISPKKIPLSLQVNYLSGGGAAKLPVQVSAVLRDYSINLPAYQDRFSFVPPTAEQTSSSRANDAYADEGYDDSDDGQTSFAAQRLIADKLSLTLDKEGAGNISLKEIPTLDQAQELLVEASFADPNGEVVTLRRNTPIWPAEIIAGIRNDQWVSITDSQVSLQAIALDINGTPEAGIPLEIRAQERVTISTRKRLVGGYYAYDSKTEIRDLGSVCSGTSDEQGLLNCKHTFTVGGNIELIATATDTKGRTSSATTSMWITSRDELWFGGSDSDRIDLLPESKTYRTGDIARFQLRMPFRQATALVTVEREGILESHIMELRGNNPTIELEVKETWGPNIYVSALVLRGRLRDVPLYSFFDWGYKQGDQWWKAYEDNLGYAPPTTMIDLSKPAYRMGVAEINVVDPTYMLDISIKTDAPLYQVRDQAKATITVKLPNGKPAANADVAIAAVDEALLELKKNTSWNLLENMLQRRSWGVQTSTAQIEVVGRRHYGRKAIPAGGGGGGGPARELFDTLLLWKPYVKLDENGKAEVNIPTNDSLTTFRVVAIASDGANRFGSAHTKFQTTQDLQLISGLPPVIRGDDIYRAAITVRNATNSDMKVELSAKATGSKLKPQILEIPANSASEAIWQITVPAELAGDQQGNITWEVLAKDLINGANDRIITTQRVLTSVPVTVRQATLKQLDGQLDLQVKQPSDSIPGRGGIRVSMVPRLADGLPAIEDWFRRYPEYESIETKVSRALGMRDQQSWLTISKQMPAYLDQHGLLYYYIPGAYSRSTSSPILTAYVLASADEASKLNETFSLPANIRDQMLSGLTEFVEGKIQHSNWSPQKDLDMRRLTAMEALSRYGQFKPRMLGNITIAPNQWPSTSVIQWMQLLQRTPGIEKREDRLKEAQQILRARLHVAGTRLSFSTEKNDYWWWMMWNADLNAAYLILAILDDPQWQSELPKLVTGFIARQQTGAWHTTTSNLWGSFALEQFSRKFERDPVSGLTQVQMTDVNGVPGTRNQIDWSNVKRADRHNTIGTTAPSSNSLFGAPSAAVSFVNNTVFLPWLTSTEPSTVTLTQNGSGKPWATIQSLAAAPLKAPFAAGYNVTKTITPISEQVKSKVIRGDIWRIRIDVDAQTDMSWVVINDPIPGGSTILGTGLGRDSQIALDTETDNDETDSDDVHWQWDQPWLVYQEFAQDGFRAYYEYVPKGQFSIEYNVRLNNEGSFVLPPTRVEAIYAPEMYGELPNATVTVGTRP